MNKIDVVVDCWFMDEKGEMKTEFIPTPTGVDFSKKKKKKRPKRMNNKQINAIYSSFLSPTPPDHHPPLFKLPLPLSVCGFGSDINLIIVDWFGRV